MSERCAKSPESDYEGSRIKNELYIDEPYMKDEPFMDDDDAEIHDQTIGISSLPSNILSEEENKRSAPQTDGDIKELFVIKHEPIASDYKLVDFQYSSNLHTRLPTFIDEFGIVHNLECRVVLNKLSETEIFEMRGFRNESSFGGNRAGQPKRNFTSTLKDEKRHACKNCDYRGVKASDVKRHMRTHTGERPFACNSCDYRAAANYSLRRHIMTTHRGEKSYPCNMCEFKAGRSDILKIHMFTHTGERSYACDFCDYRTGRLDCMKLHWTTHTRDYRYPCNICNYKAQQLGSLRAHMTTHMVEGPHYVCDICDFRSVNVGKLRSHKTRMHKSGTTSELKSSKKL
uniref:Myoneurin n=2 Tax=Lygus hesperus TaxID=30085 RepID=A0A146L773_LYGHE